MCWRNWAACALKRRRYLLPATTNYSTRRALWFGKTALRWHRICGAAFGARAYTRYLPATLRTFVNWTALRTGGRAVTPRTRGRRAERRAWAARPRPPSPLPRITTTTYLLFPCAPSDAPPAALRCLFWRSPCNQGRDHRQTLVQTIHTWHCICGDSRDVCAPWFVLYIFVLVRLFCVHLNLCIYQTHALPFPPPPHRPSRRFWLPCLYRSCTFGRPLVVVWFRRLR